MTDLTLALFQQQQDRQRIQENSARLAYQSTTHQTTGNGWVAPQDPILFDTKFTAQPNVTSGCVLLQAPNYKYYKYPQVTAGVTSWVIQHGLYVGAHVFFAVQVDPIRPPRTDGSNLAELQAAQAAETSGTPNYVRYSLLIDEATMAVQLALNKAQIVVEHNLLFVGVALKGMPNAVTEQLNSDAQITPLTPPLLR